MNAQHTPGPWRVRLSSRPQRYPRYEIFDKSGRAIAEFPIFADGKANELANLFVRAVNAHDEMVAALEKGLALMPLGTKIRADWQDSARAALAKAKVQP